MKRRINVLLVIIFMFLFSFNICFATTESTPNWIRIMASTPEDVVFENNIVVEIKNAETKDIKTYTLGESNDYIDYFNIEPGTYEIKSAVVIGEYEGNFKCGFSKEKFTINEDSNEVFDIPIIVEFYVNNSQKSEIEKEYKGLSNEEILDIVRNDPPEISDDSEDLQNNSYAPESNSNEYEIEDNSSDSIISTLISFVVTLFFLGCLCVIFYIVKFR